ncbi:uncharacterized protein EI97DRAFT_416321 [Westerdykella ornata]|uniref:Uncharacterized protein n=1 Tax=Westerdykella ornata TaxID=318751 RepID=A0A6A6JLQ9_WESOR|nr:uncharacterized protein EI97DRAFT_416321 [Westerdykella ornata]KAF2277442.1 hypothetical protein EI97DRAFT_416321 [Westerdykella ornata]
MDNMDEVLVHITTPTTRQKDEVYRSLANAYHQFEPCSVHHSEPTGNMISHSGPDGDPVNADTNQGQASEDDLLPSKESFWSFPTHVSSEKSENFPPPDPSRTPADSMADSLVDSSRLAQLERIRKVWKKRQDARSSVSQAFRSSGRKNDRELDDAAYLDDTQLAAQAIQSQLSDTCSMTSEDTSDDEFNSCYHGTAVPAGPPPEASSANADDENKRQSPESISQKCQDSPVPEKDYQDRLEDLQVSDEDVSAYSFDLDVLPVQIVPPGPTISVGAADKLPSQMTAFLHTVKRRGSGLFVPVDRTRALEADERGYWSVDTTEWPVTTQNRFWRSLNHRVSCGDLGWGILLYRESECTKQDVSLGRIRVYCWGEVAEAIWLVLWICSGGNIHGSLSKWLDAEGTMVIQMP